MGFTSPPYSPSTRNRTFNTPLLSVCLAQAECIIQEPRAFQLVPLIRVLHCSCTTAMEQLWYTRIPSLHNQARGPRWRARWLKVLLEGTLYFTIRICPAIRTKPETANITTHSIISYVTVTSPGLFWPFKSECESLKKVVPIIRQLLSSLPHRWGLFPNHCDMWYTSQVSQTEVLGNL